MSGNSDDDQHNTSVRYPDLGDNSLLNQESFVDAEGDLDASLGFVPTQAPTSNRTTVPHSSQPLRTTIHRTTNTMVGIDGVSGSGGAGHTGGDDDQSDTGDKGKGTYTAPLSAAVSKRLLDGSTTSSNTSSSLQLPARFHLKGEENYALWRSRITDLATSNGLEK